MRRIIATLVLIACSVLLWASEPEAYIREYETSFTVDLASDQFLTHYSDSTYSMATNVDRNSHKYYQLQELAVMGVSDVRSGSAGAYTANCSVQIDVELVSDGWFYTLPGSDYRRPFGLDFFARAKRLAGGADEDISEYTLFMGNQNHTHSPDEFGIMSATIDIDDIVEFDSVWWDMCLVMDPVADVAEDFVEYNGQQYPLLPTDQTYSVDLQVTLTCRDAGGNIIKQRVFPIHLEGFYKPNAIINNNTALDAAIVLNKLPGADEVRIDGRLYDGNYNSVPIATYDLTTSSIAKGTGNKPPVENGKVYMYVSSSREGYGSGGVFALHHVNDPTGDHVNPIVFEVTMTSDSPLMNNAQTEYLARSKADPASRSVTFTGTDAFAVSGAVVPSNCMQVSAEVTKQKSWFARWVDSGTISIRLTGQVLNSNGTVSETPLNVETLNNGEYTSIIYFHIITDIN